MSELAQRLRASGALLWNGDKDDKIASKALHEAATELDRLTAEVAGLKADAERRLKIIADLAEHMRAGRLTHDRWESARRELANNALDRMADNARELGLDYEPDRAALAAQEPTAQEQK